MKSVLKKILDYKKLELEHQIRKVSKKDVKLQSQDAEPARDFLKSFDDDAINIIAEVKKASPSAGVICEDFHPIDIAHSYEENGAKAISVLTDEHFFQGHLQYLRDIKAQVSLPVLRKDFTFNDYQIYEGRGAGADAMLLNVVLLDDYQLRDFHQLIVELGMMPLVEVHSQEESERATQLDLKLLGINNRFLDTFEVDVSTTSKIIQNLVRSIPVISESGLKDHATLAKLKDEGVAGFLIGETLMRSKNPGDKLKELRGE